LRCLFRTWRHHGSAKIAAWCVHVNLSIYGQ
jgi:hypothetical protein